MDAPRRQKPIGKSVCRRFPVAKLSNKMIRMVEKRVRFIPLVSFWDTDGQVTDVMSPFLLLWGEEPASVADDFFGVPGFDRIFVLRL